MNVTIPCIHTPNKGNTADRKARALLRLIFSFGQGQKQMLSSPERGAVLPPGALLIGVVQMK